MGLRIYLEPEFNRYRQSAEWAIPMRWRDRNWLTIYSSTLQAIKERKVLLIKYVFDLIKSKKMVG